MSDPVREPVPAASRRRAGGWWLPASVLLHGGLLAGVLLLSARAVLPPELEPAIPLVFESGSAPAVTPLAGPGATPPVPQPPIAPAPPAMPDLPDLPDTPPLAEAPLPPLPEIPVVPAPELVPVPLHSLPAPAAADAAVPVPELRRPRLPPPPATRPVPHLAPAVRSPAKAPAISAGPPGQHTTATGPAAPAAAPGPAAASPARADAVPARPIAGAPGNVQPDYPEMARRRGVQGRVVVRATVSAAGRVVSVEVAQSSGSEALDRAALDAVRGYSFTPASRGGLTVQGVADLPFTFQLQ